jgi:hypothetical protein
VNKALAASRLAQHVNVIYAAHRVRDTFSHTTTKGGVRMRHLSATMAAKHTL